MISVVVADDQELIREGVAAILDAEQDITVLGTAADGAEAVGLIQSTRPDVALMDIRMPDVDGIEATRRLVAAKVPTRILILTTFGADDYVLAALRAGASGFLLKDTPRASLVTSVRAVASGEATIEESVLRRLVDSHLTGKEPANTLALSRLSPRETDVLKLIAVGATSAEIARTLFISETTVKTHIARTRAKLGARDRVQLVVLAHQARIV